MAERNRILPTSNPNAPVRLPHLPAAMDHFSITLLNELLAEAAFDARASIKALTEIASHGKPMERIAAIRTLRDIARENAELNGYIATVSETRTTTPSSTTTQQHAAVRRLMTQEPANDLVRRSHVVIDLQPSAVDVSDSVAADSPGDSDDPPDPPDPGSPTPGVQDPNPRPGAG